MSGGSFDYIGSKDVLQLVDDIKLVECMRDTLRELGLSRPLADTLQIIDKLRALRGTIDDIDALLSPDKISGVWNAVEWYISHDIGLEELHKRINTIYGP